MNTSIRFSFFIDQLFKVATFRMIVFLEEGHLPLHVFEYLLMSNDRVLEEDHLPLHVLEYLLMYNDRVWRRITFHYMYWNIF